MDAKIWIIAGLVWLLWVLKSKRPPEKSKRWKLLRDKPADLADAIYHPKEWRKARK